VSGSRTLVSRRSVVAAVLAGGLGGATLTLSSCDLVEDLTGAGDEPGDSGVVSPTAPAADADSALVEDVLTAITATGALAAATATLPGLTGLGTRLARLHRGHARELGGGADAPLPAVSGPRASARTALLGAEADLQARLVDAARQAQSGALAQILAAMAAAIAQQRAVAR